MHMHSNCRNLSKIMFRHHMWIHVGKLHNVILIKLACGFVYCNHSIEMVIADKLTVHYLNTRRLYIRTTNDVTTKSREQGLITKECIAAHIS